MHVFFTCVCAQEELMRVGGGKHSVTAMNLCTTLGTRTRGREEWGAGADVDWGRGRGGGRG